MPPPIAANPGNIGGLWYNLCDEYITNTFYTLEELNKCFRVTVTSGINTYWSPRSTSYHIHQYKPDLTLENVTIDTITMTGYNNFLVRNINRGRGNPTKKTTSSETVRFGAYINQIGFFTKDAAIKDAAIKDAAFKAAAIKAAAIKPANDITSKVVTSNVRKLG